MRVVPLGLDEANELVRRWHRHHKPVQGYKFAIGAMLPSGELVGAAIVGRPVARMVNAAYTLEVTRLVTNGTKDACSFLYGACARIARELGYAKIQTYILDSETGVSLRAAGWECEDRTGGGEWGRVSRERITEQPRPKQRWAKRLNDTFEIAVPIRITASPQATLL